MKLQVISLYDYAWLPFHQNKEFDSLAAMHNDTDYNRVYTYGSDDPLAFLNGRRFPVANDADVLSVTVTCDSDWDDAHPAGTPLNDIILFTTYSYRDYIRSGYNDQMFPNYELRRHGFPQCKLKEHVMLLSMMQEADFELTLCETSYMQFTVEPNSMEPRVLNLAFQMDDGRLLESQCTMVFNR